MRSEGLIPDWYSKHPQEPPVADQQILKAARRGSGSYINTKYVLFPFYVSHDKLL